MTYLINAVNTYRVPTVADALNLREGLSALNYCELESFQYTTKYDKKADEEYQVVKAKLVFNDVKEPDSTIAATYDLPHHVEVDL